MSRRHAIEALYGVAMVVLICLLVAAALSHEQRDHDAVCARRFASANSASDSLAILRDTLDDCRFAFARAINER